MKRRQAVIYAAATVACSTVQVQAKPLRIVVPFPPGEPGDLIPRAIAPSLAEQLGQPVIVKNIAGAGGVIGATHVAQSAPDGLTLGVATVSTHGIQTAFMKRSPYDPALDFAAVSNLARVPNIVSVHSSVAAQTMHEFVSLVRNRKSGLDYASPGVRSLGHMMGELFKQSTKTFLVHIPYRSAGPALADVVAGHVKVLFDNLPASLPHLKSGRLRGLAVAWPTRHPQLPNVPTFAEVGLGVLNSSAWIGLVAPAQTPAATVQRIQLAVAVAMKQPAVRTRVEEFGAVALGNSSEEFAREMVAELQKWRELAEAAGISLAEDQ